jgi:hypothetical protein
MQHIAAAGHIIGLRIEFVTVSRYLTVTNTVLSHLLARSVLTIERHWHFIAVATHNMQQRTRIKLYRLHNELKLAAAARQHT